MARKKKSDSATTKDEKPTPAESTAEQTDAVEKQAAEDVEVQTEASVDDEASTAQETTEPEALPDLQPELDAAREEAARNLENWQRTAAELANFKRRQEEQMKLQRDRIKSEVLEGVISALDDMDLAFQNLPDELDGQLLGWVEGFRLVQRKLHKILDEQNVMPIDTAGKFDPNFHEAISYEDHNDHDTDDIIAELRKGYQIGSRVIRPALVRVAR
jgi:molecular chaperone GrpE